MSSENFFTQKSVSNFFTPNDLTSMKIEADRMRKIILDKKQEIQILEVEAAKLDELKILMRDVLTEIQNKDKIMFFPEYKDLDEIPLLEPQMYLKALKSSVSALLEKHDVLSQRFGVALKNQTFLQNQDIANAQRVLDEEKSRLQLAQDEFNHQKRITDMVLDQKTILQRTIRLTQESVDRHKEASDDVIQKCETRIQQRMDRISKIQEKNTQIEQEHIQKIKEIEQKKKEEEESYTQHEELLSQKKKIQEELKKLAYDQSCLISDLDKAKQELVDIQSKSNSYLSNLKTHQLLEAERENERLRNLLKNEKRRADANLQAQVNRTKQLEDMLEKIAGETRDLNDQITEAESKMQAIAMRIPDFRQLEQALDNVIKSTQKDKAEALKTQYMLDEIRDKNRLIEQQEYNESKQRTEQLLQKLNDPSKYDD